MTPHQIRQLCVAGYTDPRTVKLYLAGKVRPITAIRLDDGARSLGLDPAKLKAEAQRAPLGSADARRAAAKQADAIVASLLAGEK